MKEWTSQLAAASSSKPHLQPDPCFTLAEIIGWRNVQIGVMTADSGEKEQAPYDKNNSVSGIEDNNENAIAVEALFDAAQNCTQLLKENFPGSKLESPRDVASFKSMFTHTIQAWGYAILLDGSCGVHELLEITRLLDTVDLNGDESDEQAQHNLHLMGSVYAEIASQLYQIDSANEANQYFSANIADIETMIRDYEYVYGRHMFLCTTVVDDSHLCLSFT